jgi:hypothetical protein
MLLSNILLSNSNTKPPTSSGFTRLSISYFLSPRNLLAIWDFSVSETAVAVVTSLALGFQT